MPFRDCLADIGRISSVPETCTLISVTWFAATRGFGYLNDYPLKTAKDTLDIVPGLDVIATGREGWAARLCCGAMFRSA